MKGKEAVLAGDGRHNSMGHSAKYGSYTIFCCRIGIIIHLFVINVTSSAMTEKIIWNQILSLHICPDTFSSLANQEGSSLAMEALGNQKAISFLLTV